jgi:hypothetical protein
VGVSHACFQCALEWRWAFLRPSLAADGRSSLRRATGDNRCRHQGTRRYFRVAGTLGYLSAAAGYTTLCSPHTWYPDRKEGGWSRGYEKTEQANAAW